MSTRDHFHAPECDCPKCNYADGRDEERAAVLKAIDKELSDWTNASRVAAGAREALTALRVIVESGKHVL